MFASSCNLKAKKDGTFQNSTGSTRVTSMGTQGWSYNELIFVKLTDKKGQVWTIFNNYNFSPTTSRHYYALQTHAEKALNFSEERVIYLNVMTMNLLQYNECVENIDTTYLLQKTDCQNPHNIVKLVEILEGKRAAKKAQKELDEKKAALDKEYKALKRLKRLKNNISTLNYKTNEGFKKALTKINRKIALNLHTHLHPEKIEFLLSNFESNEEFEEYFYGVQFIKEKFDKREKLSVFEKMRC